MRRIVLLFGSLVLALAAVLIANAWRMPSLQPPPQSLGPVTLEAEAALARFAGAIRIPTVSEREDGPTRSEEFARLHAYLQAHFPRLHARFEREVIGGHALLYTWRGRDAQAAPVVFTAHMDVVPVEPGTEDKWSQPPFSGAIADGFVWGRGTLDDKIGVLALLEAAEWLLESDFVPSRTVYFAFGHDEEIGGDQGAALIAEALARRGVRAEFVLDEGGSLVRDFLPGLPGPVALIGIAEKGSVGVHLEVHSEGGHSSSPPRHTAIGLLARALARIEEEPMPAKLVPPVEAMLEWLAPELAFSQRLLLANLWLGKPVLLRIMSGQAATNASVRTTAAATMVGGGVKENVLPSSAWAVVNYRILPGDTIADVLAHVERAVDDPAVRVEPLPRAREASVVSSPSHPSFRRLATIVRSVFPRSIVAPYLTIGGTDARHYQKISNQLYRFTPVVVERSDLARLHGTDERVSVENYLRAVEFYIHLIRNLD